ncbi:group II intron maturase-specific domain-containing protein [Alkalihalobacillus deserti]|uniref:group II intron maturase-specific domain-containing protein n=1 Tax=Alkalihalobacillus deserti TaxID=2879466 RepID=UPI0027DF119F|nr:group II intron maturase-specific domain-containing protein [Alkalihalobacillus deserti]
MRNLTSRKRPGEIREIIKEINQVTRGWFNYYGIGLMKTYVQQIDRWIRRRIRQMTWKRWKKVSTRFKSLMKLKIPKQKAWEWANTRKGYWHISNSFILHTTIPNKLLERVGLLNLTRLYSSIYSKHTELIEPPYTDPYVSLSNNWLFKQAVKRDLYNFTRINIVPRNFVRARSLMRRMSSFTPFILITLLKL